MSILEKVHLAQKAGALAAVVIDSDSCDAETMHCHRHSSTLHQLDAVGRLLEDGTIGGPAGGHVVDVGLFHDDPTGAWLEIRIPVAMVSADDGARIRASMDLVSVEVEGEMNYLVGV